MQLHRPTVLARLAALEARIVVFSFAAPARLAAWVPHFRATFIQPDYQFAGLEAPPSVFERTRFVADPALAVYQAYGLGRNRPEEVFSRKILRQYARWRAEGRPVQAPTEDPLQRGGNFVVNRQGLLTLAHTGRDQSERPSIDTLLAALQKP